MEEGNFTDSLQGVEEPDPNNSSAVTDAGANTTTSPKPLGTQSTLVPIMDKHNFTSLPQWKFDDLYRLDPQFKQSVSTVDNIYRVCDHPANVGDLKKICEKNGVLVLEGFWTLCTLFHIFVCFVSAKHVSLYKAYQKAFKL